MKKEITNQINGLIDLVNKKSSVNMFYTSPGRIKQWKELQDEINSQIVSCLLTLMKLI